VLSKGIELFETIPKETKLELFESKSYESGVVEMKYKVKKTASSNLKNYWSGN